MKEHDQKPLNAETPHHPQKTPEPIVDRTARIRHYETLLNEADEALSAYEQSLEDFSAAQKKLRALNDYYGSPAWWEDFNASEAGQLPPGLRCGVLSEDGIYNLLERNRELLEQSREALAPLDGPKAP